MQYRLFYPSYRIEAEKRRKRREKKRRYRENLKKKKSLIIEEAKSVPCTDCEGVFDPSELEFDHLRDKLFTIGSCRSMRNITISKLMLEIEKCEVVCTECHTMRERARGRPR